MTYVSKIAGKTGISGKTQGTAISILRRLGKNDFQQERPYGLSCRCPLYRMLAEHRKEHTKKISRKQLGHRSYG